MILELGKLYKVTYRKWRNMDTVETVMFNKYLGSKYVTDWPYNGKYVLVFESDPDAKPYAQRFYISALPNNVHFYLPITDIVNIQHVIVNPFVKLLTTKMGYNVIDIIHNTEKT